MPPQNANAVVTPTPHTPRFAHMLSVASYDVGQTYLASVVFARKGKTEPFRVVHWAIDEFAHGSAPHQPVTTTVSVAEPPPQTEKRHLTECMCAKLCAQTVRRHAERFFVEGVLVEHQLDAARRNCIIETAVVAACAARGISCMWVHPSLKMQFCDPTLQLIIASAIDTASAKNKRRKQIAVDILRPLFASAGSNADFRWVDAAQAAGVHAAVFAATNVWYHKDLADAFLQGLHAINNGL